MKPSRILLLFLALPALLDAETVFLKDGKVHAAKEMRRDGNFLFLKVAGQNGAVADILTPLNQVDRVDFGDPPVLSEARQMARMGDAAGVLEKTASAASFFRGLSDVPGSLWPDVMRLRLPALAVKGDVTALSELQKQWTPTGDAELDTAYRLLVAAQSDPAGAQTAWKALALPGAGTLGAGISWLALGTAALEAKQWKSAVRSFLSIEVFLPSQRLLQPAALMGAARAFLESGERAKAAALVEEIKAEYPSAAGQAAALLQ